MNVPPEPPQPRLPQPAGPPDEPRRTELVAADVGAVALDDALLTALGAGEAVDALVWDDQPLTPVAVPGPVAPDEGDDPRDRAAQLLAALRADIDADIDADRASDAVRQLTRIGSSGGRRVARLVPRTAAAATAAALVLSMGGVAAAAIGAGPSSWLYPLHRVLVGASAPTASQRAAAQVRAALDDAAASLDARRLARASTDLASAARLIGLVSADDGAAELSARLTDLTARLDAAIAASGRPAPQAGEHEPTAVSTGQHPDGRPAGNGSGGQHGASGDHRKDARHHSGSGQPSSEPGAHGKRGSGDHKGGSGHGGSSGIGGSQSGDHGGPPSGSPTTGSRSGSSSGSHGPSAPGGRD